MDMLIKLYELPPHMPPLEPGVVVRKPIGPEHGRLVERIAAEFGTAWASEARAALAQRPVSLFIAMRMPPGDASSPVPQGDEQARQRPLALPGALPGGASAATPQGDEKTRERPLVFSGAGTWIGFAAYDATARGMFGPIGVTGSERGRGVGAALLQACLHDMRAAGYAYAVAGAVAQPSFFARVAFATEIEGSEPGVYAGMMMG